MPELLKASAEYIDSGYQPEKHKDYRLSIQLRLDGFSFAYIHHYSLELVLLQDYRTSFKSNQNAEERWQIINDYFIKHLEHLSINAASFFKVSISIDHKEYCLNASSLFKDQKLNEQIEFNQHIPYSFISHSQSISGTERTIIFALPKVIHSTLSDYFADSNLMHLAGVLENEIHKKHKNQNLGNQIYVYVSNRDMHIMVMNNEDLLYHNAFKYTSKEDFIYFILLVYDQLNLNPEKDSLTFSGDLSRSSALFGITWQYIRNTSFIHQPNGILLNSTFDQIPIHQYFLLIQSTLCES